MAEGLDPDQEMKIQNLLGVFPGLTKKLICRALRKCKWDTDATLGKLIKVRAAALHKVQQRLNGRVDVATTGVEVRASAVEKEKAEMTAESVSVEVDMPRTRRRGAATTERQRRRAGNKRKAPRKYNAALEVTLTPADKVTRLQEIFGGQSVKAINTALARANYDVEIATAILLGEISEAVEIVYDYDEEEDDDVDDDVEDEDEDEEEAEEDEEEAEEDEDEAYDDEEEEDEEEEAEEEEDWNENRSTKRRKRETRKVKAEKPPPKSSGVSVSKEDEREQIPVPPECAAPFKKRMLSFNPMDDSLFGVHRPAPPVKYVPSPDLLANVVRKKPRKKKTPKKLSKH